MTRIILVKEHPTSEWSEAEWTEGEIGLAELLIMANALIGWEKYRLKPEASDEK